MLRLIKSLFCRHQWGQLYEEDGKRYASVTLEYVGGFKTLHRCQKCGRLKFIKITDNAYAPRSSSA